MNKTNFLVFIVIVLSSFILIFGACSSPKNAAVPPTAGNDKETFNSAFAMPQDTLKPWVYYYWISDHVSKEGITKDLEAMANVGIGQALIGNIGLENIAYGKVPILSEEWWQLTEHAIREGKRVGVNIGLFNCPGWSQSGGPWVKPTEAMRYLTSAELKVDGGVHNTQKIAQPKDTFQDVCVIAFPTPVGDKASMADLNPIVTASGAALNSLMDGDKSNPTSLPLTDSSLVVDASVISDFTARSLVLYPAEKPFSASVKLQAAVNNRYVTISSFKYDRTNPAVNVGPVPYSPVAISFPQVTARKFRLLFSEVRDRSGKKTNPAFTEIELTASPKLERYAEKQLNKMFQTPLPLWKEFQWANQAESGDADQKIQPEQVLDISKHMAADGTLNWKAPAGKWTIMRIGVTPTGTMNSPSAANASGLEVDKMNRTYLENHFNAYMGKLLQRMPVEDRTAWKHVVMDSYEMGPQNWTEGLAEDFKKRYGYDPIKWLPVISGRIVGSADESNRFLWDLRRIVADRVAYDYVGGLRDISAKHGLRIWLENYGHWGFPSEFLMYGGQSHEIAGEFWNEGELGNIECRAASSAAHIYGHQKVFAESYTSAGKTYERYPAMLKKRGDWSFTEGINSVLLHLYIHQPYEEKSPGINAWFGTEFNRKNTWFEQSKAWIDYQRRCMYMLQRGHVVNDVAYFIGEDAPKMTGIRNPELPKGYSYDYINAEVIKTRLRVVNGKLTLPDGMSYRLLVLPQLETMRPELLESIKKLVEDGATILGPAPKRSPSLQNFASSDKDVQKMARELWGDADGISIKKHAFGKGVVLCGMDMQTALKEINLVPDLIVPEMDSTLYIHRREGETEIYFITNQTDKTITINPSFRVAGMQPELFDATDGSHRSLPQFTQDAETTTVPLRLEPAQSFFVVFRSKATAANGAGLNFPAPERVQTITTPWLVNFNSAQRGPKLPVTFTELTDWSKNTDTTIKYYSGSAVYSNTVDVAPKTPGRRYVLQLGDVKYMATIKVNGLAAGAVWCPPYEADITDALKTGTNKIEIEVVNTWANRLIGDSRLPEVERKTWLSVNTFKPSQPLQPSGLFGPVKLMQLGY